MEMKIISIQIKTHSNRDTNLNQIALLSKLCITMKEWSSKFKEKIQDE